MPVSKGRRKSKVKRKPTPPSRVDPAKLKGPSPTWYIALMFSLMGIGALLIILNYVGVLPGGTDTSWLLIGLVGIASGFGMTLNFR